jgi:hypothetical protein
VEVARESAQLGDSPASDVVMEVRPPHRRCGLAGVCSRHRPVRS